MQRTIIGYRRNGCPIWLIQGASEPPADQGQQGQQQDPGATPEQSKTEQLGDGGKAAIQAERQARKAAEDQAKALQSEIDKIKEANATDAEKTLNQAKREAKVEGESAAQAKWLPRVVAAEFRAEAAGKLSADQLKALLEDIDLTKFVREDGEVDVAKITKKIEALAPQQQQPKTPPPFNGGPRQTEQAANVQPGIDRLRHAYAKSPHQ